MEKVNNSNNEEKIELDFEIPDSGNKWTPKQLERFDAMMRTNRVPKDILTKLLLELKSDRQKYGDDYPVSEALGYVFNVVIDKNLGNGKWRGYTADWKQEMRDRAIELLIKHSHNFSTEKMLTSKNIDPYYYLGKITFCAFIQAKEKLEKRHKRVKTVALNEAIMSNFSSLDEFIISANQEIDEQERREKEAEENGEKLLKTDKENGDYDDLSSLSDSELNSRLSDKDYMDD